MSMVEVALAAAAKGFRVFPAMANGKIALLTEWPVRATTDEETIKQWWSGQFETKSRKGRAFKIPASANVGICPGDDFVVIDVDTDVAHKNSGIAEFKKLIAEGLPQTLTVRTPSGGLHLYYKHPAGKLEVAGCDTKYVKSIASWRAKNEEDMTGIDIRGNKGFALAPGSLIDGVAYTVQSAVEPVELPEHIAKQLPFRRSRAKNDFDISDLPEHLKGCSLATDDSLQAGGSKFSGFPDKIPMGNRDSTLFSYACSWRERGYPTEHAMALMKELLTRVEQGDDPIDLETACDKVTRAYETYASGEKIIQDWTSLAIDDTGTTMEVPTRQLEDLKAGLKRFIFVEGGDRVVDTARHAEYAVLKLSEFKNSFRNIKFEFTPEGETKPKKVPFPEVWLGSKYRRTVREVGYHPIASNLAQSSTYKHRGEELYNLWVGSELVLPVVCIPEKCKPFLAHMEYIFGGDVESMNHFLDWMAFTVQYPHIRIQHAVLLIGDVGTGKGWIYKVLELMLGDQNVSVVGNQDLESDYNTWISRRTLAVIDDITPANGTALWDKVRSEITETSLEINRKFGNKGKEQIFANILIFSNHPDAICIDKKERRLWVYLSKVVRRSDGYYVGLFEWLSTEGPAHLMKAFLARDLSKFNPGMLPPQTRAKTRMFEANQSVVEQLIMDGISDKEGCFVGDIVCADLVEQFLLVRTNQDKLDPKVQSQLRRILVNLEGPLPQDRYRVNGRANALRLKCVRNWAKWGAASAEEITAEWQRARDESVKGRPNLAVVS